MIYVDRYRFAREPKELAAGKDSAIRSLLRSPKAKAGMAARFLRHGPAIIKAYRALSDDASKALFVDLMKYRLLGPHFTKVAKNKEMYDLIEEVMGADVPSQPAPFPIQDTLGQEIRYWDVTYKGHPIKVLAVKGGLYSVLHSKQYYYETREVTVQPEPGDVLLDGGAFLGEISLRFAIDVGPEGRVYGFDPFPQHAKLAAENARLNGLGDRLQFMMAGVSDKSTVGSLAEMTGSPNLADDAAGVNAGRRVTAADNMVALDDFCEWAGLDRLDFIKLDVEGSEVAALKGAHEAITRFRPKLAVSLYHRYHELWTITNFIRDRYPFYDLYLGHYTLHFEETVLYAIDRRKRG